MRSHGSLTFITVLLGIVCSALSSCASASRATREAVARLQRMSAVLQARGDADSLAAAAVLVHRDQPGVALTLVQRAVQQAPNRPDLLWLNSQMCAADACDPRPLEARLRELDAGNGAAWLGAVTRAQHGGAEDELLASLGSLSRAERVDTYWVLLVSRLSTAVASTKQWSLAEAVLETIDGVVVLSVPQYAAISDICKGDRLGNATVLSLCRGVARAMTRGDTYITEMVGLGIGERVWAAQTAQGRSIREARRTARYRMNVAAELAAQQTWDQQQAEQYLSGLTDHRREQDATLAQITRARRDPNPPADWRDEAEEHAR